MDNYLLDLHTHTVASGHAYSTLEEMVKSASEKGLEILGITEHGPAMPGTCNSIYFENLRCVPRNMYGVELLLGAELNILDTNGHIDLDDALLNKLDIVIASLHIPCFEPKTKLENTQAMLSAIKNPRINILGHPDDGRYPVDYVAIVQCAKEYGTMLELNNSSLNPNGFRKDARKNDTELLKLCINYDVPIVINSDAHISFDVGRYDFAEDLLNELCFPNHLIINQNPDLLRKMINDKKKSLF